MGAYMYCNKCGHPAEAPWEFNNDTLLKALLLNDYDVECRSCCEPLDYDRSNLIEELANRIGGDTEITQEFDIVIPDSGDNND